MSIKRKATQKISSGNSVVNVSTVTGGTAMDGNATFTIAASGATGSFQGFDAGASDVTAAETTTTLSAILTACESHAGLKEITVQPRQATGSPAPVSLG